VNALATSRNHEEDAIYPLTTREIVVAQEQDLALKTQANKEGYSTQLVKNMTVLCKDNKMIIPKSLQASNTVQ
jgi:hypothetical protein